MERSDSANGAKRLHIWSEATQLGGGAGGGGGFLRGESGDREGGDDVEEAEQRQEQEESFHIPILALALRR